jgi:hypothetical protein
MERDGQWQKKGAGMPKAQTGLMAAAVPRSSVSPFPPAAFPQKQTAEIRLNEGQ